MIDPQAKPVAYITMAELPWQCRVGGLRIGTTMAPGKQDKQSVGR